MIPLFKVRMANDAPIAVTEVLRSGFIGQGEVVEEFEREFEQRYAPFPVVSTNSCTSAIHAVLIYLGVGPGDEVITTPLTCVASNAPILAVGARPVWADVDEFGNISPQDVRLKITARTKAIIAVNWTGRPANYGALRALKIPVIEDAAHGPVRRNGPYGDFVCYSFGPIKHLTTGDGGAISTPDPHARAALRLIRWYGLDRTSSKDFRCAQDIKVAGLKFHMTDINAAIGLANLPLLDDTVQRHQMNARSLWDALKNHPHVHLPEFCEVSNYWVFPVLVAAQERDRLKQHLEDWGIASSPVHARNDKHTAYDFPNGALSGLMYYDTGHLNIPCGWWLTEEDVAHIVAAVHAFP